MSSIAWRALPRSASTSRRSSSFTTSVSSSARTAALAACDLDSQLLLPLRQVRKLALHSEQRGARRLLGAAPRLDLDGDGLRGFAVLLGAGPRSGHAFLVLAPLLLELFARRGQVVLARDRGCAACFALLDGADERLLLRCEIRDRAIERGNALPRLIELGAARAELRLRIGEQLLPARGFGLRLRASFLEPLELETRVGKRFRDLLGAARSGLRAFAQAFDLVAARDDADLRIVAAIHPQPMPRRPRRLRA